MHGTSSLDFFFFYNSQLGSHVANAYTTITPLYYSQESWPDSFKQFVQESLDLALLREIPADCMH